MENGKTQHVYLFKLLLTYVCPNWFLLGLCLIMYLSIGLRRRKPDLTKHSHRQTKYHQETNT